MITKSKQPKHQTHELFNERATLFISSPSWIIIPLATLWKRICIDRNALNLKLSLTRVKQWLYNIYIALHWSVSMSFTGAHQNMNLCVAEIQNVNETVHYLFYILYTHMPMFDTSLFSSILYKHSLKLSNEIIEWRPVCVHAIWTRLVTRQIHERAS